MSKNPEFGTQSSDEIEIDPAKRRRSRMTLIGILLVFAIPLGLASIWLHMVRSSGGALGDTSRGELIKPAVPFETISLTSREVFIENDEQRIREAAFELDSLQGVWTMLYLPEGECAETCQQNLYHMRQVRLALNHRMDRVQRAVLSRSEDHITRELMAEHPGLLVASGSQVEQQNLIDQVTNAQSTMPEMKDAIYLVDPFGNLMMRFSPELSPKSMLKDVKHLLKVSRIG